MPVSAATASTDYDAHWASEDIHAGIAAGITTGYADGTFRPENAITRAEFFVMVNNAFKFTTMAAFSYTDVGYSRSPAAAPSATAVATAVATPVTTTGSAVTPGAIIPVIPAAPIAPVGLGLAGDYVILAKTGIVLGQTNITMGTHSSINGRLLAQTAVTLDASTVVAP